MIVISDTGPLNYLLAIGEENCLVQLFSKVVIPASVLIELQKPGAPQRNIDWATCLPANFSVSTARKLDATLDLGCGEREAISLADELHPSALLIDEKKARSHLINA